MADFYAKKSQGRKSYHSVHREKPGKYKAKVDRSDEQKIEEKSNEKEVNQRRKEEFEDEKEQISAKKAATLELFQKEKMKIHAAQFSKTELTSSQNIVFDFEALINACKGLSVAEIMRMEPSVYETMSNAKEVTELVSIIPKIPQMSSLNTSGSFEFSNFESNTFSTPVGTNVMKDSVFVSSTTSEMSNLDNIVHPEETSSKELNSLLPKTDLSLSNSTKSEPIHLVANTLTSDSTAEDEEKYEDELDALLGL